MTETARVLSDQDRQLDPRQVTTPAGFAEALTGVRLRAGRSIRSLARATGIPSATLGGYFSGRHLPPATQPQLLDQVLTEIGVSDDAERQEWREALLRARRAGSARAEEGPGPAGASPYRGLEPFTEQDAALFFGREDVVDGLAALVDARASDPRASGLVFLVGPSGSGKSSLLRAGLVPHLRDREDVPWATAVLVPGRDPMAALAAARAEVAGAPRALIVVDQAEEVFSPEITPEQRGAFGQELLSIAQGGETRTVVVAGLRADFYGQAAAHPALLPALRNSQVLLGSMSMDDLRRAVVKPAESVGVTVDPELVDLLLRDVTPRGRAQVGYEAGALPLVSHALLATWQAHRGSRLTVADYVASGGIAGAVQQTAERLVAGLDQSGRVAAQWLFAQLVVVDDDGVMTRRRVQHDDLHHPDPATDLALDAVIEAFVAGRLITARQDTIEVSHEALLSAWPRLRDWVLTDVDAARLQRRIAEAAGVWRERDRDSAALLRGGLLDEAQSLAAQPLTSHRVLGPAEREFVEASTARAELERAAERRQTNRLRALLAVMTALALLAGVLSGVAFRARDAATQARDEALSRQLAISANTLRDRDPALAAQLALAAYRVSPTVQARSSLLDSTGVATPTRFAGPVGSMNAVASPDGSVLAISNADGVTRLWQRVESGEVPSAEALGGYEPVGELAAVGAGGTVYSSTFSPDGDLLGIGTADGALAVWDLGDVAAPRLVGVLIESGPSVQKMTFSDDGSQLAAGTSDPAVRRWSIPAGGGEPVELTPITDGFTTMVKAVAYTADGTILATGSADSTIRIWATPATGTPTLLGEASVGVDTNFVHDLAFSPDGTLLASAEKDRLVRLWDVSDPTSPEARGEPLEGFGSWVNAVAFSPDGRAVAAGSSDGLVRLYAVADGRTLTTLSNPSAVTSTRFVGSGTALLTSEVGGVARLWPLPGAVLGGFSDSIWSILEDAEQSLLGVAPGARDGSLYLFDRSDAGGLLASVTLTPPESAGRADGAAAMSSDGRWVAVGTATGRVVVWERTGAALSFRPAGVLESADQLIEAIAFDPTGALMAAIADDGSVNVWTLESGATPELAHGFAVSGLPLGLTFSPDSSLLAVATSGDQVHLWRLDGASDAEELPPLTGFEHYAYSVAFHPSGRYLAAGSTDRTVRIWDVTTPDEPVLVGEPIRGPGDTVYSLDWSRDGSVLAGASKDGAVWLWDVADPASPQRLASLLAADSNLYSVALRLDGQRVSAGGTSHTMVTWDVDADAVAAATCARTGTAMTEAEWEQVASGVPYGAPCPAPAGS